ncbi:MAG: PEP-CTERM sorting domain-containing protein [Myxococcota bacterium]
MARLRWASRVMALGAVVAMGLTMVPRESDALNLVRARLFRGGSNSGPVPGWPNAPASIDPRNWPPACGKKQATATSMFVCAARYFGAHPNGAIYGNAGPANSANSIMFDGNGWDIQNTRTVLGNIGFPVLILRNLEDYGNASFGPGLGAGQAGTITFNATGNDPATLGTEFFQYDPDGNGVQTFKYPPNSAATTPRPDPTPPNHGGVFRYVTGAQRFGGTLNLTGVNAAYLVLTFNPGVATTGSFPVIQGPGQPIPVSTTGSGTIPGATLIHRNKGVEIQKVRINNGLTPGGFVDLGSTVGSRNTFAIREEGPWTTGMVTVTQMSRPGVFPTTTTRMDVGGRSTVMGVGTVQIVQPFIIRSKGPNGNNGRSYTNKLIVEVPEPGSLLLIGSGVFGFAGLALARKRRAR